MKIFYLGVEMKPVITVEDILDSKGLFEIYIADGNLYIEAKGEL